MWNMPQEPPPAAAPVSAGDGSLEGLVEEVKQRQRSDPNAKDQWHAFVDLRGAKFRDPAKHTPEFLQEFLAHLSSGVYLQIGQDQDLSAAIKALQSGSPSVKYFWSQFCLMAGNGRNDPTKHGGEFHVKFFDTLAQQALQGMGSDMAAADQNPMKRMRDSSGMGIGMGMGMGGGATQKDILVNKVKAFQRMSPETQDLWARYSDTYLGGMRDPSRHDEHTLQEFCANHNVPDAPMNGGGGGGYGGDMGGGRGGGYAGVIGAPGGGDGMSNLNPIQPMTPEQEMYVARVKNYTRTSDEAKEAWTSFCGKTRDPARHPTAKLQEFCAMYSVM